MQDCLETVQRLLREQTVELGPDDDLLLSGAIDSIGMMRLLGEVEKVLGRRIPPADLVPENFFSPRAIATYLESLD